MKILHYTLGLPPYRTGGLTKYSIDLMISQQKMGMNVNLLFPGRFNINKKCKVRKYKPFKGINVNELINPLPVPLLGGIKEHKYFSKKVDKNIYLDFLSTLNPDIIHIHTLMGIHKEFFEAARQLQIKLVYTTHDYFGICPKVNLLDYENSICSDYQYGKKCNLCNENSYSIQLIYIMQSKLYRNIKENIIIKKLRRYKRKKLKNIDEKDNNYMKSVDKNIGTDYIKLRKYYIDIFKHIDYFHFNSSVSKQEFTKYIPNIVGDIIPITHMDVVDKRVEKNFSKNYEKLKISYLGPIDKYKGFYLLKESLDELNKRGNNQWILNIYGNDNVYNFEDSNYIVHGKYNYNELEKIFRNTDILIIPSICKETFGFIGLEALSYGVPILVSEHVGFKDIVEKYKVGKVFKGNIQSLSKEIEYIINDRDVLKKINQNILKQDIKFNMDKHSDEILDVYKKVLEGRLQFKC